MTENNYTLRLCSVGNCTSTVKGLGYCSKHYMQHKRGGIKEPASVCKVCNASLEGMQNNAVYCGQLCKRRDWAANNPEKHKNHRVSKVSAVYFCSCVSCSKNFTAKKNRAYCSKICRPKNKSIHVSQLKPLMTCKSCLIDYVPFSTGGCPSSYCSIDCVNAGKRKQKKIHGSNCNRKRAKKYGAYYEPVNPIKVFDRDKWTCKLCGVKTPKALRNTYADNAPELDHIIPISLKGAHSYLNTQCSCRKCNGAKSNKPLGQLLMFG